jgi:hypothetical protein
MLRKALVLSGIVVASSGAIAKAETNTGLDLTKPVTSIGYSYQNTYIAPGITGDTRATDLTIGFGQNQFTIVWPYSDDLHFTGSNTGTKAAGDVGVEYNYVFPSANSRLRQTLGAASSFPSNSAVSSGEQQFGGLYQMAYDVNQRASLLFLAQYAVGTNPSPTALRYNELTLKPSALMNLKDDAYLAVGPEYTSYSGQLHDSTYDARLDVGKVFAGHYNLSAFYALPLTAYSYDNLYRSTYGVKLSMQL